MLEAVHLGRTYGSGPIAVAAVRDVSLQIAGGEIACVVGRSGSGKSTLLHLLGCLDRPTHGQVKIHGQDAGNATDRIRVAMRRQFLGFVFQSGQLLEHLTAEENVALPLAYAGIGRAERLAAARVLLEQVGLAERRDFRPSHLSGGEQQRIALARALVNPGGGESSRIVLADEPTGELDSATARSVADLFCEINRELSTTFLIVTHDPMLASIAGRRFEMMDGILREV